MTGAEVEHHRGAAAENTGSPPGLPEPCAWATDHDPAIPAAPVADVIAHAPRSTTWTRPARLS
ncbi:hypothetical protein [Streptomyces sp. NPDC058382]|uniref:hypothetical protein n=1 Tax=unclassified Streptomyces TaxID=2593676 RepID=UPI00363D9562